YAAAKNIGLFVWYNSGGRHNQVPGAGPRDRVTDPLVRDAEFARLAAMGIKGVKVDFMQSDKQFVVALYHDIIRDAARHHLMVNFHGATIPRGWERTYPNLMTTEAVYGAEWYNNGPVLTEKAAAHNTTLPFTRNVIGPMDYTPVTFSNSQNPHITSYAHE